VGVVTKEANRNNQAKITFGACMSAYVTLLGITCGLLAVSLLATILLHFSFWQFAVVWFVVSIGTYIWLRSFKLVLSESEISSATLFSSTNSLKWSEIKKADFRTAYKTKYGLRDSFKSPFRLVLVPRPSIDKMEIAINLKLLNRKDIMQIMETLERKLGGEL
jgi:hypothetical protein